MGYETIILEREGDIGILKLNRPPVNALSTQSYLDIYEGISEFEKDDSIGAIIVTGGGDKAFAAGLDVKDVMGKSVSETLDFMWSAPRKSYDKVAGVRKPTIAVIFGPALGGGCELALACDFRIASEDALFGVPEITLGIIPGGGGTQRLPRLVGLSKARELLLLGETVGAEEAYKIGLVNKVVPREKLMDEARAMAKKLAAKPRAAYALLKNCIEAASSMDSASGLTLETNCFTLAFTSEDGREGISAFVEKRKPSFKSK